MKSNSKRLVALACASLFVLTTMACGGSETGAPPPTQPATTAAPAKAPAGGTSLAVAEGDFGVPECDNYMKKYLACIDSKVPETARAALKQAFERSHMTWQQAAATADGKAGLAAACTQAETAAKQAMMAYNCEW